MTALYQNHAGNNYLGAPIFDLVQILKGIPVSQMAIAMDVRHTEQIDHADPKLLDQRIAAIGRDVATLQTWLEK